ncbi:MAG: ABC transporter ATP-binding protein [Gemmatimonadota bacterium]|nr:ABC transporter ATP-binding protein [Gemmatimonadota bacterium]
MSITKRYEAGERSVVALDTLSLEIAAGEFVSIMGTSGSGKTTLLQVLGTLDVPTSGSYVFNGERVDGLADAELSSFRNRTLGFVFQSFNLLARCTAAENVMLPGLYSADRPTPIRVAEVMQQVGIEHRRSHFPFEMSGGEQQRVAIARALVMQPVLLLADEPTGNLDETTGDQIMNLFCDLHRAGLTIVLVTHDPLIAARAGRIITLRDGAIVSDTLARGRPLPEEATIRTSYPPSSMLA